MDVKEVDKGYIHKKDSKGIITEMIHASCVMGFLHLRKFWVLSKDA